MNTAWDKAREAIRAEIQRARVDGLVAGLEAAAKFVAVTKSRKDIAMMIDVAIATAKNNERSGK